MGVTSIDIPILTRIIHIGKVRSVVEFGAQNNFAQPYLPAPYMRDWYESKQIRYDSLDLNGECGAAIVDFSEKLPIQEIDTADLVTDFGTSEHVSDDGISYGTGKFSWEAIYNCWKNKFDFCKTGGWIISENPKTGNWPGHGFNYYTQNFYVNLANKSGLSIFSLDEVAAMGNTTDGWNILCVMRKVKDEFPTLEEFKELGILQS